MSVELPRAGNSTDIVEAKRGRSGFLLGCPATMLTSECNYVPKSRRVVGLARAGPGWLGPGSAGPGSARPPRLARNRRNPFVTDPHVHSTRRRVRHEVERSMAYQRPSRSTLIGALASASAPPLRPARTGVPSLDPWSFTASARTTASSRNRLAGARLCRSSPARLW